MRKFLAAASVAVVFGLAAPSQAAVQVGVAGPGAAVAGQFLTPVMVVSQSAPAIFVNADPTAPHDLVSVEKRGTKRLFESGQHGAGQSEIVFLPNVEPGDYAFICSLHPNMKGTMTLLD